MPSKPAARVRESAEILALNHFQPVFNSLHAGHLADQRAGHLHQIVRRHAALQSQPAVLVGALDGPQVEVPAFPQAVGSSLSDGRSTLVAAKRVRQASHGTTGHERPPYQIVRRQKKGPYCVAKGAPPLDRATNGFISAVSAKGDRVALTPCASGPRHLGHSGSRGTSRPCVESQAALPQRDLKNFRSFPAADCPRLLRSHRAW